MTDRELKEHYIKRFCEAGVEMEAYMHGALLNLLSVWANEGKYPLSVFQQMAKYAADVSNETRIMIHNQAHKLAAENMERHSCKEEEEA